MGPSSMAASSSGSRARNCSSVSPRSSASPAASRIGSIMGAIIGSHSARARRSTALPRASPGRSRASAISVAASVAWSPAGGVSAGLPGSGTGSHSPPYSASIWALVGRSPVVRAMVSSRVARASRSSGGEVSRVMRGTAAPWKFQAVSHREIVPLSALSSRRQSAATVSSRTSFCTSAVPRHGP